MTTRRERRARTREKTPAATENNVPLSQPSRHSPRGKTLIDIANERQLLGKPSQNNPSITTTRINPDGSLADAGSIEDDADTSATSYLDIIMYSTTLTVLHFTLTVLVHHQYASTPPSLSTLLYDSTLINPIPLLILILVAALHPRSSHIMFQVLFASMSVMAGAWLVHASNEDPYMAVMRKAPPLGTLWIWAVVELRWEWAVSSLGIIAGWGWWRGYSVY